MQYYFCPRCKFRMVAVKKHICPTCGYKLPRNVRTTDSAEVEASENQLDASTSTPSFLSKLFKWQFNAVDTDAIDSTQEKPVLN